MVDYNWKCPKCGKRPDNVTEDRDGASFKCYNEACQVELILVRFVTSN